MSSIYYLLAKVVFAVNFETFKYRSIQLFMDNLNILDNIHIEWKIKQFAPHIYFIKTDTQ